MNATVSSGSSPPPPATLRAKPCPVKTHRGIGRAGIKYFQFSSLKQVGLERLPIEEIGRKLRQILAVRFSAEPESATQCRIKSRESRRGSGCHLKAGQPGSRQQHRRRG